MKFATTEKMFNKLVKKPSYMEAKKFLEDEGDRCFVAVELAKPVLKLVKAIYSKGFSVLELSKVWMYQFHYEVILKEYGYEKVKLLFTDNDSLTYHIQTEDFYEDMKKNQDCYDTSNYPKDHFLYSDKNKKVIGKFKDDPVMAFVAPICMP